MVFENPRVPDSDSRVSADRDFFAARGAATGPGAMANSLPLNKAVGSGPSASAAAQPHVPVSQADTHSRRPGGSGAFGAGASTRPGAAGRNNQAMRKQHKQRRPKLAYDDAQIEAAAIRSTSSRKGQTSITHLMNFTLPPRPQSQSHQWHGRPYRRNPTWGQGSGYHAIDKSRYIHANYRFIVDPRADYKKQVFDADAHLEWNNVLQILASAQTQVASCPICLSVPVAPRMARCGHIFCMPCLIRYMHSAADAAPAPDKKSRWKKCPICWDSVYMAEVKPVRFFQGQEGPSPGEGSDVVLKLMEREPGRTLALPKDGADLSTESEDIPWFFAAEAADYAHIMKGSEDYMVSSFNLEIEQVRAQEQEDEVMFGDETEWSKRAVSTIRELTERMKGIGNPPDAPEQATDTPPARTPIDFQDQGPEFYSMQAAAKSGQSMSTQPSGQHTPLLSEKQDSTVHSKALKEVQPVSKPDPSQRGSQARQHGFPFYFYQGLQHYYLSPLDIRILKAEYGAYSNFPAALLARVEKVSVGHVVDEDLRKRAKYLGHLPRGCEVGFLECDWSDIVSAKVLAAFRTELERRRKYNREKAAREEKERIRAEREEDDKRWAAARRRRPSISRARDPSPIPENLMSSTPPGLASSNPADSASPPWGTLPNRTGSAFASLASPSTSPSASRTVWGTAAVTSTSPTLQAAPRREVADNDGWLQDWEQDLLREDDALVAQIQDVSLGETSSAAQPTSSGKKKKQKKITLMSTNARRAA